MMNTKKKKPTNPISDIIANIDIGRILYVLLIIGFVAIFALGIFFSLDWSLGEKAYHDNYDVCYVTDKGTHHVKSGKTYVKKYDVYFSAYFNRTSVSHQAWNEIEIGDEVVVRQIETWGKWTGRYTISYEMQE